MFYRLNTINSLIILVLIITVIPTRIYAETTQNINQDYMAAPHVIKEKAFVRRAKGMNGIGIFGGKTTIGASLGLEWSYQAFINTQLKCLGGMIRKIQPHLSYKTFFLQSLLSHTVFANYNNFCVNIGEGIILTHMKTQDDRHYIQDESKFNVGILISGELELYVFRTFEITLSGGPIVYILQDHNGRIIYQLNLGIKFNF